MGFLINMDLFIARAVLGSRQRGMLWPL